MGRLVQYAANLMFGVPLMIIYIFLAKKLVDHPELLQKVTTTNSYTIGIKMIPFVGSLPGAALGVYRVNRALKNAQKTFRKELKTKNKELKKLQQGWLRRAVSGKIKG
ncbi:MAG: hypothetical protein COU33_00935 [Candidatus Magasanikbacteria bacterium CG10_big_fil_rev_8_21_14_0_10_43_6]|uniref:Uncharacterized protein n=1 Tax=Candidatus Magasanikbacteria bacterium CG10_big_fil_rev_8_21_14_0_10_43_6 TaxID=1974650 RepID=A0A2M6W280_9BACT|nr:MAG: hypothetical protein COU33_00935 [Candidatus Magasanikbacteria bacterium CG10_big_fil_rev_8_21_14_0_10_43_6]